MMTRLARAPSRRSSEQRICCWRARMRARPWCPQQERPCRRAGGAAGRGAGARRPPACRRVPSARRPHAQPLRAGHPASAATRVTVLGGRWNANQAAAHEGATLTSSHGQQPPRIKTSTAGRPLSEEPAPCAGTPFAPSRGSQSTWGRTGRCKSSRQAPALRCAPVSRCTWRSTPSSPCTIKANGQLLGASRARKRPVRPLTASGRPRQGRRGGLTCSASRSGCRSPPL